MFLAMMGGVDSGLPKATPFLCMLLRLVTVGHSARTERLRVQWL
jgi:hypothetical protein